MKFKVYLVRIALCFVLSSLSVAVSAHDIYFCGEKIPINDKLVAEKLMNYIKKNINVVNLPSLRQSMKQYMKEVEEFLRAANLPQDLKYLAIVESGFKTDVSSHAGAAGFWQLMPATARELNLTVNGVVDERKYFHESSVAACKLLATYYMDIRRTFGISSWVLTAAAYNNGIGNIKKAISNQGKNYFSMNLNPETAAYVYKIIAVKELFEYPELYMKNFGYNVFNSPAAGKSTSKSGSDDITGLGSMKVEVNEADGLHPTDLKMGLTNAAFSIASNAKVSLVAATITGKYKRFEDDDIVSFILEDNLQVRNRFTGKGQTIQGRAWLIDGRVLIDLGYEHRVIVFDHKDEKGIKLKSLKNKKKVILKVIADK